MSDPNPNYNTNYNTNLNISFIKKTTTQKSKKISNTDPTKNWR